MTNIQIQRDHEGKLHVIVGNEVAVGARVANFSQVGEDLCAVVFVPLKHVTLGEVKNVIPFVPSP